MIGEKYRKIKLFYGIRDILAIKKFFKQYFIPTRVPHYIPISIPHFILTSVPFLILSPYAFRSAFYPHIRSAFYSNIRSVPQIRSVPHLYPHFNLTLTKFANFLIIVLHAEIVTFLRPKVAAISTRNTIMRKFANFVRLYFPHITTFFNQILGFYYF